MVVYAVSPRRNFNPLSEMSSGNLSPLYISLKLGPSSLKILFWKFYYDNFPVMCSRTITNKMSQAVKDSLNDSKAMDLRWWSFYIGYADLNGNELVQVWNIAPHIYKSHFRDVLNSTLENRFINMRWKRYVRNNFECVNVTYIHFILTIC